MGAEGTVAAQGGCSRIKMLVCTQPRCTCLPASRKSRNLAKHHLPESPEAPCERQIASCHNPRPKIEATSVPLWYLRAVSLPFGKLDPNGYHELPSSCDWNAPPTSSPR